MLHNIDPKSAWVRHVWQNMDKTVDPCDDFYRYACGGWSQFNLIPDDKARFGAFSQVSISMNICRYV